MMDKQDEDYLLGRALIARAKQIDDIPPYKERQKMEDKRYKWEYDFAFEAYMWPICQLVDEDGFVLAAYWREERGFSRGYKYFCFGGHMEYPAFVGTHTDAEDSILYYLGINANDVEPLEDRYLKKENEYSRRNI